MKLSRRATPLLLALLLSAGAACSGDDAVTNAAGANEGTPASTTTTAPPTVASPLTGLPVSPELAARPAVSVKVDNSPDGRPQAGLAAADVIFEEKVEGGVTRFISVFHSTDADLVGPIRSLRTTDPAVVSPLGGVFAFSDGVAIPLRRLRGAPVTPVSERDGAAPFTYPKGRHRPYATFAATARLRREAGPKAVAPPGLMSYFAADDGFSPAGALPATKATVDFGGRTVAVFDYDIASAKWLRTTNGTPHTLADGSRLAFDNVIIQKVPYRGAGYRDSSGSAVDEAIVIGSGEAVVLVAGQQVKVRWSKPSPTAVTQFTDSAGSPLRLAPGRTIILLPPTVAPVTIL